MWYMNCLLVVVQGGGEQLFENLGNLKKIGGNVKIHTKTGILLCFCLVGESQNRGQNGCGEFLKLGRRILNSIGVIMAVNIPLSRRIKNLGRRIKDFFLSWAGEIRRSPGQNKTPGKCRTSVEIQKDKKEKLLVLN